MNLNLLVIRCANIELSKIFYEQLGLIFVKEKHGNGAEHYSSVLGSLVFEIYPLLKDESLCNTRLGFSVANINTTISSLELQSKYEFNEKTVYVVIDPDGRKIELS